MCRWVFFFQAEDGIRDAQESRGLGDVYKRQDLGHYVFDIFGSHRRLLRERGQGGSQKQDNGDEQPEQLDVLHCIASVSYTHLTLPTIYSV